MAQHMSLHLVSASIHARYVRLSVEQYTQVSITATKFSRQKFCVRSDLSNKLWHPCLMLKVGWRRAVWITRD